ncbi:probable G-protein coupled receptor 139 [Hemitrygon akajei]|uniref:probable G-protein coupled receptor 139 n=1 Tax=Hemitrygon akajei TaxID=2704970 RepID=UPI003BFA23FC
MRETYQNVEKILYVIIAVIGVPVNLLAIGILSRGKCGLSDCTTRYLVSMAVSDLLVIVTEVILSRIKSYYFPLSFIHITPVCSGIYLLSRATADCSVWFTVTFTFDRFIAICCHKLKTKYCTGKNAAVVLTTTGILFCLKNIPYSFTLEPTMVINNVPWFCRLKRSLQNESWWSAFDWLDKILTPFLPFAAILLVNTLTVRHILVASRVRKKLKSQNNGAKRSDPEMESRRKSVTLLLSLSGSFLFLWLTNVLYFIYYLVAGIERNASVFIFAKVGILLRIFSCCTNAFIYTATQSKFRAQITTALMYPIISVYRFINKTP